MLKEINRDQQSLSKKSKPATVADKQIITDLADTLQHHSQTTVGMAANMIGEFKRIIIVQLGMIAVPMINPVILRKKGPYQTQEGCLSLEGERPTQRFEDITVQYLDRNFHPQQSDFYDFTAQIIQHEIDHCNGIII